MAESVEVEGADGGISSADNVQSPPSVRRSCWATWTVPFDKEEEFTFLASAYYLSPAVRAHWEKQLGGPILWFGTTLENIAEFLEKLTGTASGEAKPAAAPPAPAIPAVK